MSELDLQVLAERGKAEEDSEKRLPISEIDDALKACGFGLFHLKLLFVAFIGLIPQILVSGSTAYLLPSAECDLNMSLLQKGMLNAISYFGMLFSSAIAGFLTDAFGRKIFLMVGFGGIFVCTIIAGTSQTYNVLITAKFFEGVLFATSFSAVVSLTSEFCHKGIRDRVMLCQSSLASFSHIVIAAMSWVILIQDWHYTLFNGKIVLNTWNFYLYIMSIWSFLGFVMYSTLLPESPKFLATHGKYDEARNILISVYKQNTRKPADTYPYINIWKDKTKYALDESKEVDASIKHQLVVGLHNIKPMFRKPLACSLALICFMNFNIVMTYNVLRLWFPQLSAIIEHNSLNNGDMCQLLDKYTDELKTASINFTHSDVCVPNKSGNETYINSIIIGCVCLIPVFITGVLVNKVGKKSLLSTAGLICVASVLGLRWANTKIMLVALFSISVAVAQTSLGINQTITVEVFPTTTRTLAISLMMTMGRLGTLVGNIMFPILLNMGCVVPFYTLTGLMFSVAMMSFFLPTKK